MFNNTYVLYGHGKLLYTHTLKFQNLRVKLSPTTPTMQGRYRRKAVISGLVAGAELYECLNKLLAVQHKTQATYK